MSLLRTLLITEAALFRRDTRGLVSILFFTALTCILLFFGLEHAGQNSRLTVPSCIWLATLFGGTLQLGRSFDHERDEAVLDGLRMIPNVPGAVYLSKSLVNLAVFTLVFASATFFTCVMFNFSGPFTFILPILLGAVGACALGTTFSFMLMTHRQKGLLLPALLYPLLVPVVIAVQKASDPLATGGVSWLGVIIAFNVIILTASYLMFEDLVEA